MVANNSRHSIALTGALVILAVSFGASAAALDPPSPTTELHKAPPAADVSRQLDLRFEALIKERFQQLLEQRVTGVPVVNVLFGQDGSVEVSDYGIAPENPEASIDEAYFARHFHLAADEVAFTGLQGVVSATTGQKIMVAFTQKKQPNGPAPKNLFLAPDTRSIDRSLVQRYFPEALQGGVSAQTRLWVLFDNDGKVLRTGTDTSRPAALTEVLETQYPGIRVEYITATPVTDEKMQEIETSSGEPLQLFSMWLKKGSTLPQT